MKDWKEYLSIFKEFFNTLAGKLTAILAFALLVIVILSWFGAGIPAEYLPLVYIVVIVAMLISGYQAFSQAGKEVPIEASALWVEIEAEKREQVLDSQKEEKEQPSSEAEALSDYLDAVIAENRPLRLAGLDEQAGDPNSVSLSLEKIYVALNTTTSVEREGKKEREESRLLPVIEALEKSRKHRMVLLGFPGTGKSTFVRYLALMIAQEMKGDIRQVEDWAGKPILPLPLSLGRFAETLPAGAKKGNASFVKSFILDTLKSDARTEDFAPYFFDYVDKNGALFLFDGLDEVANMDLRPIIVQSIEEFAQRYGRDSRNYFFVTCRTYSYQDPKWQLTDWEKHELDLLSKAQIVQFVRAWYQQHTLITPNKVEQYEKKREQLLKVLHPDDRRKLYKVARYPIILTVMAVVHASDDLPDSRAQVYEKCVNLLLEKWDQQRSIAGRKQVKNILVELDVTSGVINQALWEIAYKAHLGIRNGDNESGLITKGLLSGVMTEFFGEQWKVETFLDYCEQSNGLLMLQGKIRDEKRKQERFIYTFPHLTFEEYLAARYLGEEDGDFLRNLLDESFDRWREVALLLGEHLCFSSIQRGRMNDILEALSTPKNSPHDEKDWRAVWLAGELLVLYRRGMPNKKSPYEGAILQGLLALLEKAALSPRERADVADLLDTLGYRPKTPSQFIQIPAPLSPALGRGAEGEGIYMAKYLVTNEEYARFLKADDFHEKDFWVDFPKFSAPKDGLIEEIGVWKDDGYQWLKKNLNEEKKVFPRYWDDPRFGNNRPSAPVNAISWYEANAYSKWLLAHWDNLEEAEANPSLKPRLIRLPTENEWSFAAGGEKNERFAWGVLKKEEITRYANTRESEINRTTPVWMYPVGASSPYKLMDMSGNLWEWQANYRNDRKDRLSLRGGSWYSLLSDARVSARLGNLPYDSGSNLGFRLVLLPSLSL